MSDIRTQLWFGDTRNMPTTGGLAIASDTLIIDTAQLWAGESE